MKTPEEMMEYFRAMPSKLKENPYWEFVKDPVSIQNKKKESLDFKASKTTLMAIRQFFRLYYESFKTEAQVLCVTPKDGEKLMAMGVPVLTRGQIGSFEVDVVVLPQDNHMGTSVISESFWQNKIVNEGIKPVARIHSHHVLNPYQSQTDYSTLNSGTLEMVIGRILDENLQICYWLDVPGTDIKAQTFLAEEKKDDEFVVVPHIFNGSRRDKQETVISKTTE